MSVAEIQLFILSLRLDLKRKTAIQVFVYRASVPGHGVKSDHFYHLLPFRIGLHKHKWSEPHKVNVKDESIRESIGPKLPVKQEI
jgi:hypothetical protein